MHGRHGFLEFVSNKLGSGVGHIESTLSIRVGESSITSVLNELHGDEQVTVLGSDMEGSVLVHNSLLIHVLAFTKQNSYLIKVTFFTGTPDMCESFFGRLILGHIESKLVLGSFHSLELIIIGLKLEEHVGHLRVTVVGSVMKTSPLSVIDSVNISTFLQEKFSRLDSSFPACHVQRRAPLLIRLLKVRGNTRLVN